MFSSIGWMIPTYNGLEELYAELPTQAELVRDASAVIADLNEAVSPYVASVTSYFSSQTTEAVSKVVAQSKAVDPFALADDEEEFNPFDPPKKEIDAASVAGSDANPREVHEKEVDVHEVAAMVAEDKDVIGFAKRSRPYRMGISSKVAEMTKGQSISAQSMEQIIDQVVENANL